MGGEKALMPDPCTLHVQIRLGPPVITSLARVRVPGKLPPKEFLLPLPFPCSTLFLISAVAQLFAVSPRRIYNLLSEHRQKFDPPLYKLRGRYAPQRLHRFLSEHDLSVLQEFFPVLLSRKKDSAP